VTYAELLKRAQEENFRCCGAFCSECCWCHVVALDAPE
jgi:hypothetical protein